ncbi:MAG: hypothetical protein K5739_08620 [Lachnospiraceae bacterium]|nr:hypothetical protein [Lachnospiraceae bacterium]
MDGKKKKASLSDPEALMRENEVLYGELIYAKVPEPKTIRRMSPEERAAQFSSFAALSGYGDVIRKAEENFAEQENESIQRIAWTDEDDI